MAPTLTSMNRLLLWLPEHERVHLLAKLEPVALTYKEPLFEPRQVVPYAYFPITAVLSLVVDLQSGEAVETGTIGREGMAAVTLALGEKRSVHRGFCQVGGEALRMPAEAFAEELERNAPLRTVVLRYATLFLTMVAQTAACNRAHPIEARLSRWLLMTRDRMDSDEMPLTQQFLSQMLGVRRPTVSLAGGALQDAGLIRYSRGRIVILDRNRLEQTSCECYQVVRDEFDRRLGPDAGAWGD